MASNNLKADTDENDNTLVVPNKDLISECKEDTDIIAPEEALNNVLKFAKENHLKYKRNKTVCKVCDVKISSSFKKLKEHVALQTHKDKVELFKTEKENFSQQTSAAWFKKFNSKIIISEFVFSIIGFKNIFSHNIVINKKYFMSAASFGTISEHRARRSCLTCELLMNPDEVRSHLLSVQHRQCHRRAFVLIEFETEFVREVRPGVYHCGFCNFIEDSRDDLNNHLKSINHGVKKDFARSQLYKHMVDERLLRLTVLRDIVQSLF